MPSNIIAKPFLKIDGHLLAINRIVSVDFIVNGRVFNLDGFTYFNEDIAREHAREIGAQVKEITTPIIVINYKNVLDVDDFIRRHSEEAENLWNFLTANLSTP